MSFIITTSSNTGGIIIPNGDVEVIDGGTQTFQFLPDIGYTIDKLLIDGIEQEIVDSYTFENVTSDHVIELIFEPLYYNITSSSINEGGTVYPLGNTNVQQGNSQTFNFFPNENYKVSKVLIDGIEVDNKSAYTFNNVIDNHTIDVEFEYVPRIFEINVMYTTGGKLNPEKTIKVIEGTNEVFDIIPDDKYELEYLSIDSDNVEVVNNQYVFENISDNHSIFAKFKYVPSYYVINASCNEGGKITNIGDHSYIEYSTIEYIFTPEYKHRVKNVTIDDISYGSIEKYTFNDLSSDHVIDVEFEYVPEVFTIQTSCDENGILSQTGEIKVQEATTFNLNIQPDYGYKIKEILVDGQIVDKTNVVSIENIWENHTIDVSFEPKIIYTITSSCDDNCKIYPLGQVDVYEEDNQKFEISANSGYFIKSIKVDDIDIEFDILKTFYVFENMSDNHNIVVESEKIESQYFISSIASNHGNISPNGANSYKFGENVTYNFTPISGYKLNHVIVDGKKIKVSNNTYTFYNVRANHTITATFTPIVADVSADKINGLDLILNYDIYNRVEPSNIYLSKPKKHLLGVLNGVDEQSCNVTLKANNTFTLTFDVSRYVDGEESNYYNNIDVLMELYVSSIGWFKITQSPEINFDGNNERLTVTAESYEIELQQYDKVGFLVNKASQDSIEMMATDNTYLDENGYVLFRDNVLFHRDTSQIETLLDDFTSYNEEDQTIDNLKKLLVDNPFFLTSAWRFDIDIDAFMSNITEIKANLMGNGYDTDYLDEFQKLYNVKDSSTGESSLTTAIIKSYLVSNSELIEYIPFDINDQNVSVKNKIFNCSSENSNGDLSAVLNVENAYCIQGSEINFNIEVGNNKGDLTYKYMFGEDEHCMTDYISQNSISWTSYYSIDNEQYISIPITVEVVDTYIDDDNVKQTQTLELTTYVYIFIDKDTLSEYLVENDIALTYAEYEKYSLVELIQMEIQRMKDLSLLDQILLECPSWTVGFVDKYIDEHNPNFLCDEVGSFEIDSQDVYSLLTQTLAQYFSCIFVFDTVDMTVNAYRIDGIGKDTNIHLGYRNIQNSVSVTPSDELYTVFNVSNGDTLNLAYVNFGDREIEDISYFLTEEYLDSELIKKYNMWQEYRESLRDEYIEYSKLYNEQNNVITELYNRVPVDGLDIEQYKSFSYNELDEELHNYIALIEGIKSCFKIVDNESQYETIVIVASEEYNITYEYDGLRENLEEIQKSIYWNEYKQYKQIVENILIAMNNFGMDEDDENYCDYIDDWQWDMITYGHMYGLDELKVKLEEFKNGLDVYKDYALPYEETDKSIIELNYNAKRDEYLKYKTAYDKCIIMLNEREIEVSIAESILNEYYTIRNDIAQNVSKVNWSNEEFPNGFSDEDLEKLGRLYKSTDYVNENIIYTSTSSTEDIVDKAYELYEDAVENLYANSHPRMTYSTSVDNLFAMVDYYNYVINDFSLYNFLRLSIRDDYQVKLRVIECSLNPMVYDNNLNIVFSNMVQYKSKRNDFASLLDNAISSAKNQISSLTKSSNSDANEFSFDYDMVKSLLNSKAFGSYMNSYRTNSISPEALETALSRLDNISTNSAFIKYLNSNLLVTNDAYIDYLNSNLVVSDVADIRTLMFGSATGNVLQSNFSNSVISLLGDATIKSAMIESLNASKINAGAINTNHVEISSDSGNMKISDNTIQIKDDNDVTRVQIGKDASNDYNMYVLDENGKVMFDATGLHEDGIKNGIIRDDMVSDNANISGSKLNIQSLYSSMNDSGYSLNASNVKLDAENQSLEVSFNILNSKVTQQGNSISSYGTKLSVLQGQIDSKIWKSDVETLVAESETLYNLNTQFSEFEQTLEGFETTVSRTNSRIDDLGGIRNLILDSDDVKISTSGTEEFIFETSIPIKPNSEYTFVLHGFANNSDLTNGGFALYFGNNLVEDKILCRTESETLVFTVTSPNVITDEYHVIFKNIPSETVLESKLEWICMYEGNASSVSNSWIPAPEDSAIMTKEAYSVATQTATDFSWLVTKDENTSEMTLSDEVLEIISKSVEINGTVSFGTFEDATKAMLSSRIEANTNAILKLYTGDEIPTYTPTNLVLNAYSEYSDNRTPYSGKFKIEERIGDVWSIVQEISTDATTSFEFNLNDNVNSSATQLRCSIYTNEETPILIDSITLDIFDNFSAMLSVKNNKTYIDGGNVYCATLDANAILSNDIIFTGTITGGDVDGGGLIKSFNYEELETGVMLDLYNGYMSFGKKSSINDTSKGVYFEETGQFYFGDDEHYIRYYQTNDGDYKLTISTDNITFGNGQTLETAIDIINSKNKNLIELNNIKTFIEYGGIIQDSKIGKSVSNYIIDSNNRYNLIGFKIDHSVGLSTYTISGKTDLDQIKISLSCWNEKSEPLEDYYSNSHSIILDVNNDDTFVYTFEVPEETSFFNIGIGDNECELNGQNTLYSYNEASSTWTSIDGFFDDFKPYHYDGSCIVHNDLLYIIGGRNYSDSMFVFSLLNNKLIMEKKLPYSFINGSVVMLNNEIHILGGENSHCSHYKYNIEQDVFSEVSNIPYKFYKGSAVIFNDEIHILGGMISQTNHYKFDTSTSTWVELLEIPYAFHGGELIVANNEMHLLGGTGYNGFHYKYYVINNEEFYLDMGNMWNSLYNGSAVLYNNTIHVLGDFSSGGYNHYKYDIASDVWESAEDLPCSGENGSAFVYNNQIYIFGGYSDNSTNYTIEKLQLEKGTEITDWKPSLIDMSNEKNSISSMVEIGYLSYVPLVDIQTMTSDCLVNDTNYYTYERDCINCIYQPKGQFYASFNHWCTQNKRYLLSCYDSNLYFIICELNYNDEILNISSPTIINENSTYVDTIEYEFTVSQEADQFYILIGHPFENSFSIESVKLYAYESNINTNVNVVGNLNVSNEIYGNRLLIEYSDYGEDDLLGGTTALVMGSSINAYDELEAYISTYNKYASLEISSDDRLTLKSNGEMEIYTEDEMHIYSEFLHLTGEFSCNSLTVNGNTVLDTSNYTTYCAKASHTHTISNITNLQATLDGKANTHSHPYLSTSGGTVSGALTVSGKLTVGTITGAIKLESTATITTDKSIRFANGKYMTGTHTDGTTYYDLCGFSSSNVCFLGNSNVNVVLRGSTVKLGSTSGSTVTSDFNLKTDIKGIDNKYIEFFKNLKPKTYKYKLGRAKRPHLGFIAQEVEQALNDSGLTTDDFAGICIEETTYAKENEYDEHDDMNYAYKQGLKEVYSLRYEEFISLNTRMIQEVMTENEVLKFKVQEQDEIIKSQDERISILESTIQQLLNV